MRKWTHAQQVPDGSGQTRNQTSQVLDANQDILEFDQDTTPQPIDAVPWGLDGASVHPILTTPTGDISHFPDHMHEGEVIHESDIDLDATVAFSVREYPKWVPTNAPLSIMLNPVAAPFQIHPSPRVIANGRTTVVGETSRPFPLVGLYDGDLVGVGRIIVDSTWHHWFTYNLAGFKSANSPVYEQMIWFFRNCLVWLLPVAKRRKVIKSLAQVAVAERIVELTTPGARNYRAFSVASLDRHLSEPMILDLAHSAFASETAPASNLSEPIVVSRDRLREYVGQLLADTAVHVLAANRHGSQPS